MKLQHYLGGLEGLPEHLTMEKRVFVEDWEQRIFGIHVAMMGLSNHLGSALPEYPIDEVPTAFKDEWTWADLRTGAEAMNPFDYFKFRYYEKWLGGITQFFVDKGYVTEEELAARVAELAPAAGPEDAPAIDDQVISYLRLGDSPRRDVAHPKFPVGSTVRVREVAHNAVGPGSAESAVTETIVSNVPSIAGQGLHYLTPPRTHGQNWEVVNGKISPLNPSMLMGIPQGWYSNRVMVAFSDGHVEAMAPEQLVDMRLWANRATSENYDY